MNENTIFWLAFVYVFLFEIIKGLLQFLIPAALTCLIAVVIFMVSMRIVLLFS